MDRTAISEALARQKGMKDVARFVEVLMLFVVGIGWFFYGLRGVIAPATTYLFGVNLDPKTLLFAGETGWFLLFMLVLLVVARVKLEEHIFAAGAWAEFERHKQDAGYYAPVLDEQFNTAGCGVVAALKSAGLKSPHRWISSFAIEGVHAEWADFRVVINDPERAERTCVLKGVLVHGSAESGHLWMVKDITALHPQALAQYCVFHFLHGRLNINQPEGIFPFTP